MKKQSILDLIIIGLMSLSSVAIASDNPFKKGASVYIKDADGWVVKDKTVTLSGAGTGVFYHLMYDRRKLRLRITDGAEDSESRAKRFQNFAVEDIKIDGRRLPLFKWCLANQVKHSRFLQQGLKVKQDVCSNLGDQGTFIMRLNEATLDALKSGQVLSFHLKPFRSKIKVSFDISDFSAAATMLSPKAVETQMPPANIRVEARKKCMAKPPEGLDKVKAIAYDCDNTAAKNKAEASVAALVSEQRKRNNKVKANQKAQEQSQQDVSNNITDKMLAVCKKKWAKGEHRCYCEKFIKHAPMGIESDPSCNL